MPLTNPEIDERWLRPDDFGAAFGSEPPEPAVAEDLHRCRLSRRRHRTVLSVIAVVLMAVVAVTVVQLLPSAPRYAVPSGPVVPPPASSSGSASRPGTDPTSGSSSNPSSKHTAQDTAPPLRYGRHGYVDRHGLTLSPMAGSSATPFADTTANTYRLVQQALDPSRRHLEPYVRQAFTGGSFQIGQKLGWKNRGESGEGMLQVAVARAEPGTKASAGPNSTLGQCDFVEPQSCRKRTIAGQTVYYADLGGGGFVLQLLQADGEVASLTKDPVFGNNTNIALKSMDVAPAAVVALLTDPRLDVIG